MTSVERTPSHDVEKDQYAIDRHPVTKRLCRAISLSDRASILVAISPSARTVAELLRTLSKHPKFANRSQSKVVHIIPPLPAHTEIETPSEFTRKVFGALIDAANSADAFGEKLFVLDLTQTIYGEENSIAFLLQRMNEQRNRLISLPGNLLICILEHHEITLMMHAKDIWSIVTDFFRFANIEDSLPNEISSLDIAFENTVPVVDELGIAKLTMQVDEIQERLKNSENSNEQYSSRRSLIEALERLIHKLEMAHDFERSRQYVMIAVEHIETLCALPPEQARHWKRKLLQLLLARNSPTSERFALRAVELVQDLRRMGESGSLIDYLEFMAVYRQEISQNSIEYPLRVANHLAEICQRLLLDPGANAYLLERLLHPLIFFNVKRLSTFENAPEISTAYRLKKIAGMIWRSLDSLTIWTPKDPAGFADNGTAIAMLSQNSEDIFERVLVRFSNLAPSDTYPASRLRRARHHALEAYSGYLFRKGDTRGAIVLLRKCLDDLMDEQDLDPFWHAVFARNIASCAISFGATQEDIEVTRKQLLRAVARLDSQTSPMSPEQQKVKQECLTKCLELVSLENDERQTT